MHLSPVRARLVQPEQPLTEFRWSSYPLHLKPKARPAWLRMDRLLAEWRIPEDSPAGRRVLLAEELARLGWSELDLEGRRKGDAMA